MGTEYLSAVLIGTDQLRFEASLVMGMYEAVCEIVKAFEIGIDAFWGRGLGVPRRRCQREGCDEVFETISLSFLHLLPIFSPVVMVRGS